MPGVALPITCEMCCDEHDDPMAVEICGPRHSTANTLDPLQSALLSSATVHVAC